MIREAGSVGQRLGRGRPLVVQQPVVDGRLHGVRSPARACILHMWYTCSVAQLHFSVDRDTAERLAREAEARGLSLSQYLASIVRCELPQAWPKGYLDRVVGSCAGSDLREPIELPVDDIAL